LVVEAKERYEDDDIRFDDDAAISDADAGVWVAAWVWVSDAPV
jgi:hypothetical protein